MSEDQQGKDDLMLAQRHAFLFEPSQYPVTKTHRILLVFAIFSGKCYLNLLAKVDYWTGDKQWYLLL